MSTPPAASEPEGLDDRARRLYVIRRRYELLAVVNTLVDLTMLLHEKFCELECEPAVNFLEAIEQHARLMAAEIRDVVRPENAQGDAIAKAVNHDLRNHLTVILGNGYELRKIAPDYFLDAYIDEIDQIRYMSRRAFELVDTTVAELRSAEGCPAIDEVHRYLNRMSVEEVTGPASHLAAATLPGRILVAEDQEEIQDLIFNFLRDQGHTVEAVSDGGDALAALESRPFDLVLTDIVMPKVNGFGVIEKLKGPPHNGTIPVIIISGHGELDLITRGIKIGAEDYLPKPFSPTILKARVDACLEKKHLRDIAEQERRRYDELLRTILPERIVNELIHDGSSPPRRVEGVAVLFADIVGFTTFCHRYEKCPEVVVRHLRSMFEAWEIMATKLGVQKIKTIGDGFMAASGLLAEAPNAVLSCVHLGLELIKFTQGLLDDDERPLGFDLRVGLHWGTVVCGILGRRQFLFDLWGDTVNIASRLESQGKPGRVNLSLEAWSHVAGLIRGEEREVLKLRGKPAPIEIVQLDPHSIEWLPSDATINAGVHTRSASFTHETMPDPR